MKIQGILVLLAVSLFSSLSFAQGFDDTYEAFVGDYNSDGHDDIYIRQKPEILILHGDVATPIVLPPPVDDFILENDGNDSFTVQSAPAGFSSSTWTASLIQLVANDFNMDGIFDVLVKGIDAYISGIPDQIVFLNSSVSPAAVTVVDDELRKFVRDVAGYIRNTNYFEDAGLYIPWPYDNGGWVCNYVDYFNFDQNWEGQLEWEFQTGTSCVWVSEIEYYDVFNPVAGSYDALLLSEILDNLPASSIFTEGWKFVDQAAAVVDAIDKLESIFDIGVSIDVEILGGVLRSGGELPVEVEVGIDTGDLDDIRGIVFELGMDANDRVLSPPPSCHSAGVSTPPGSCRYLASGEVNLAQSEGIPISETAVEVHRNYSLLALFNSNPHTIPPNRVYIPSTASLPWMEDYSGGTVDQFGVFLHEIFHAYQISSIGALQLTEVADYIAESLFTTNREEPNYCYMPLSLDWDDYNWEQQAQMVGDRYRIKNGRPAAIKYNYDVVPTQIDCNGGATLTLLDGVIPF